MPGFDDVGGRRALRRIGPWRRRGRRRRPGARGGNERTADPMSPYREAVELPSGAADGRAPGIRRERLDGVDDEPPSRKSRPRKPVSSPWTGAVPGRARSPASRGPPGPDHEFPKNLRVHCRPPVGSHRPASGLDPTGRRDPSRAVGLRGPIRTTPRGRLPPPWSCPRQSYRPPTASKFAFPDQPPHVAGRPWESAGRSRSRNSSPTTMISKMPVRPM